jgi:hypothetical protein
MTTRYDIVLPHDSLAAFNQARPRGNALWKRVAHLVSRYKADQKKARQDVTDEAAYQHVRDGIIKKGQQREPEEDDDVKSNTLPPAAPSQVPLPSAAQSPAAAPPPATCACPLVHSALPSSAVAPPPLAPTESSSRVLHHAPHPPAASHTVLARLCDQVVALQDEQRATRRTVDLVFREVIALRRQVQAIWCSQRQEPDGSQSQHVQVQDNAEHGEENKHGQPQPSFRSEQPAALLHCLQLEIKGIDLKTLLGKEG